MEKSPSHKSTYSIRFPAKLESWVQAQIESGEFVSFSEAVVHYLYASYFRAEVRGDRLENYESVLEILDHIDDIRESPK